MGMPVGVKCCPANGGSYFWCCDNTEAPTGAPSTLAPTHSPTPDTCNNHALNDGETAADCGGPNCPPCLRDRACLIDRDCKSGRCIHRSVKNLT